MRLCSIIILAVLLAAISAFSAYADQTGGPHLWLSTDPNQFDEGGVGYVGSAPGWQDDSYIGNSLPLTMYVYNAGPENKGTAYDIGLIVAVHSGETDGSITIADAFGVEQTFTYSDFTTINPYPGGGHGIDGVYAVLKPSSVVNLTYDSTGNGNMTSTASSWTNFVVKSSSFSEVHFDARSTGSSGGLFYNPASHDVNYWYGGGNPSVPEPATMTLLGLGLFGLICKKRKKKENIK